MAFNDLASEIRKCHFRCSHRPLDSRGRGHRFHSALHCRRAYGMNGSFCCSHLWKMSSSTKRKPGHLKRDLSKCQVVRLLVLTLPEPPSPHLFYVMAFFISQDSAFPLGPDLELRNLRLREWGQPFCMWLYLLLKPLKVSCAVLFLWSCWPCRILYGRLRRELIQAWRKPLARIPCGLC